MWDIVNIIIGIIALLFVLSFAIAYWPFTLFVAGVVLINVFTLWAIFTLFAAGVVIQVYEHIQKKTLTASIIVNEIIINSAKLTAGIVIVALIINAIFHTIDSFDGGYIPCSRGTPHGC